MRKRILLVLGILVLLVVVGAAYLATTTASDLLAARRALRGDVQDLDASEIAEARDRLVSASERLDGPVGTLLGPVPIVGPNLGALEAVADGARPVLDTALQLRDTADEIEKQDLVERGRVRLDLVARMADPLRAQAQSLEELESELRAARSSWLLPPVSDELNELLDRVTTLGSSATKAADAAELAPAMLGREGARTYLVLLINNVELRGAGGILSGLGTVTMDDGRIRLGEFFPYAQLGEEPYEAVPAPPEFVRRFGFAKAHTTLFINATYSPEVPDVALVASRLFKKATGIATDGAIMVDPRGAAELMPPGATVEAPTGGDLDAGALPDYIYRKAYEELSASQEERHAALLDVGRDVFGLVAERGPGGLEDLDGVAEAVSEQHLRFVSFDADEAELLDRLGASGALAAAEDSVLVTVQNQGADKLDAYIRRDVLHRCRVEEQQANCETRTTLRNEAPDGLTTYVSPRPDNEAIEFLEIYVPIEAEVVSVERDGEPAEFLRDTQGDRATYGTTVRFASGERTTFSVVYSLPIDDGYELTVTPQPLAEDARLRVELGAPDNWVIQGPDGSSDGAVVYEALLGSPVRFTALPAGEAGSRTVWDALADFWNDELL